MFMEILDATLDDVDAGDDRKEPFCGLYFVGFISAQE